MPNDDLPSPSRLLTQGLEERAFSGARLLVLRGIAPVLDLSLGRTRWADPSEPVTDTTLFDLASLTKVLVTTSLLARFVEEGRIGLDDPAGRHLAELRFDPVKEALTLRQLLTHVSGYPAWRPYYETLIGRPDAREELIRRAAAEPLVSVPGRRQEYCDINFILLGALLERLGGARLDDLAERDLFRDLGLEHELFYRPLGEEEANRRRLAGRAIAATERCPYRGELLGEVHDDNTHAVGGVAGHAGLFGTARGVAGLLLAWREALKGGGFISKRTAQEFVFPRNQLPLASHVLGWDRPTWKISQAGRFISPHSIGHLGFTGTSAWLDFDKDLTLVLLTNRVHPSRDNLRLQTLRPRLHEAVYRHLGETEPGPASPPPSPSEVREIHLVGIAGTAMSAVAGLLRHQGYSVRGSDQAIYPPVSTWLAESGIPVRSPFSPANLDPPPDLCLIGNVCSRDHAEVVEIRRRGLAHDSMAGWVGRALLEGRTPLVVTGTHGKTTTSAMLAWTLERSGGDPGFMIGGLLTNFRSNFKLGGGPCFVLEGDEYDCAYFDKRPKFLHYRPRAAILTHIEFDHADIYDSADEIEARFHEFAALIPPEGLLVGCADHERVRRVCAGAKANLLTYGFSEMARLRPRIVREDSTGTEFEIRDGSEPAARLALPMWGEHNVLNATAVWGLARWLGLSDADVAGAMASFLGVARRQQVRGVVAEVRVIDDFAHHPTAIRTTLDGLRRAYPGGRLWVAFDPRTQTTSRHIFQTELSRCFGAADGVVIGLPSRPDTIPPDQRLDVARLVHDLTAAGLRARHLADAEEMTRCLLSWAAPGDTLAILSNGGFGGLHERLLKGLEERAGAGTNASG